MEDRSQKGLDSHSQFLTASEKLLNLTELHCRPKVGLYSYNLYGGGESKCYVCIIVLPDLEKDQEHCSVGKA